jgi:hypothetical protein
VVLKRKIDGTRSKIMSATTRRDGRHQLLNLAGKRS